MSTLHDPDPEFERRIAALLLDVLIRAGLLLALAVLCFQVFSPFLSLMTWALILAVTLYPLHQSVAAKIGGRQGLAATLLVLLGVVVVIVPTVALMNSLGDSVHRLINDVQNNTLQVPPPREGVAEWPLVGEKVHALWTKAHTDLPALVQSMQPKIGNLAKAALGFVAGIGGGLLRFLASLAVAGIMMAYGEGGARAIRSIFERVADGNRGGEFVDLSTATIRAVAKGVLGVAFLQAIIVGLCLLVAGVPWAGVLAVIVLVLGIAQVPALLVTLPAIGYLWSSGNYGTGAAVLYTVLLAVAGMADNVLKPLMLGRGVDAPMPVILLGALGGMAAGGILGMFVGGTLLALGYQIFMGWVATNPDAPRAHPEGGASRAD
jgi:predicted PurR-regulated permease PerM